MNSARSIASSGRRLPQRTVPPADAERLSAGGHDADDLEVLLVDDALDAGAAVAIAAVGVDPLRRAECRPVSLGLVTSLYADGPFTAAVPKRSISRRGVLEPAAQDLRLLRVGRGACRADCQSDPYESHKQGEAFHSMDFVWLTCRPAFMNR